MVKPVSRPMSAYTSYAVEALELLGQMIKAARINRKMTMQDAAARAGISRALQSRIERGDPGCSAVSVFEAAAICGVPLFEPPPSQADVLATFKSLHGEKMILLPRRAKHLAPQDFDDDF